MHPVYFFGLKSSKCSQDIRKPREVWCILFIVLALPAVNAAKHPRIWYDASCFRLKPYLVRVQPNHENSKSLMRFILLTIVALPGVNAAKTQQFRGLCDMHVVHCCSLTCCECSQTKGIPRAWWDASCFRLKPYLVRVQPSHRNFQGFAYATCLLPKLFCVHVAKT